MSSKAIESGLIIKCNLGSRFGLIHTLVEGTVGIMLLPLNSSSELE